MTRRIGSALALLALVVTGCGGGASTTRTGTKKAGLDTAAKAADCTPESYPKDYNRNRNHLPGGTRIRYRTNPPAFGNHYAQPAADGNYVGQGTPAAGHLVHSLEHGRIEVQYKPGLPRAQVRQLEALFAEKPDLMLLFENRTGMKDDVAAVAWTHILRCPSFNPRVLDAIRSFRDRYKLKAPEVIPQPE